MLAASAGSASAGSSASTSPLVVSIEQVVENLNRPETERRLVVDARTAGRFSGTAPEPRPGVPSGHIPGSVNIPLADLVDKTGRMKPKGATRDGVVRIPASRVLVACKARAGAAR
jgi:3-mercaptopyruvate sulfurtransferase SseA